MYAQCSIPSCSQPISVRGWCAKHYMRWWRHGDATKLRRPQDRFWPKVCALDNGCWEWTATRRCGYGRFYLGSRRTVPAHRWAYEHLIGPFPPGLQSDHLCRNRACVNPAHIEPVTCQVNLSRGENFHRNKTHCLRGHRFDDANTYWDKDGWRYCRKCHSDRECRRKAEKEIADA